MERTAGTLSGIVSKDEASVLRSLARAYAEGTHGKFHFVRSNGTTATGICAGRHSSNYLVLLGECVCPAGEAGQMCKHRAALADLTGTLDRLVPDFYERFSIAAPERIAA